MAAAVRHKAPFKVGLKELFLPNVTLAFLRNSSPYHAKFQVPLWFSKLDIRDYLWHAYDVQIHSVRSYVKQMPVRRGQDPVNRKTFRRLHRPKAQKFMTVELARPFLWPEEPENYDAWEQKVAEKARRTGEARNPIRPPKDAIDKPEPAKTMREQAKKLLEGKAKWRPPVQPTATPPLPWNRSI